MVACPSSAEISAYSTEYRPPVPPTISTWNAFPATNEWWQVDLGARWQISEVTLRWEHAHAVAYRVELSTDGRTWTSVYSTTSGSGGVVTVQAEKAPARYVRVYCVKRVNIYGFSLWEVEVR